MELMELELKKVHPDPNQPRKFKPEAEIHALGDSMAQMGQKQPIVVRPHPEKEGEWMIVDGECRWRAHNASLTLKKKGTIRAILDETKYDADDPMAEAIRQAEQLALNNRRIDVCFADRANSYKLSAEKGLQIAKIAKINGVTAAQVKRDIAIANMPNEIFMAVNEGRCPMAVAEKILEEFEGQPERMTIAWEKAKGKNNSAGMNATIAAYKTEVSQEKLDKNIPKEEKSKHLKNLERVMGVWAQFEKEYVAAAPGDMKPAKILVESVKKKRPELKELLKSMKRAYEILYPVVLESEALSDTGRKAA